MVAPILELRGVHKSFDTPEGPPRRVLHGVDLSVAQERRVAIIGPSGSGKSTLLHLAAGIEVPSAGEVRVGGRDLARLAERERTLLRRQEIGLVFQFFHLLPHLSVRDNVLLPAMIAGSAMGEADARAHDLLDRVGLADRVADRTQKLSGGEMQRVALCRALLLRPKILLADEPTGNLDEETGRRILELLFRLSAGEGSTLVYVTHSLELAERADEVWRLHDGLLGPV